MKDILYAFFLCLIFCLAVVFFGIKHNSVSVAQKEAPRVYKIAGAGSEGYTWVWEDGKTAR